MEPLENDDFCMPFIVYPNTIITIKSSMFKNIGKDPNIIFLGQEHWNFSKLLKYECLKTMEPLWKKSDYSPESKTTI